MGMFGQSKGKPGINQKGQRANKATFRAAKGNVPKKPKKPTFDAQGKETSFWSGCFSVMLIFMMVPTTLVVAIVYWQS